MKNRVSVFAIFLLIGAVTLATADLQAQGQGGGDTGGNSGGGNSGGGNSGGGNSGGGRNTEQSGSANDPFGQQRQSDPFANQPRPIFLAGQVLTDDGQPPAESVVVETVCNGNVRPEGYTDRKGRFSFQFGGDPTLSMGDASVGGGGLSGGPGYGQSPFGSGIRSTGIGGGVDLTGCDLRASLPGYTSDMLSLGIRRPMDNPDVGLIVLHRIAGVVGNVVSVTTLAAPPKANKAYQSGLKEMRKKKPNYKKGAAQFEKAVAEYPEFAAAWAALGDARMAMQDETGAQEAFTKSLGADPKYLKPYNPLLQMALRQQDWTSLERLGSRYLELNPNQMQLQFYVAVAAINNGNPQKAEETVRAIRAGDRKDDFPQSHQIMGLIHSQRGEFAQAAGEYRAYLAKQPDGSGAAHLKKQLNEWEVLGVIEPAGK